LNIERKLQMDGTNVLKATVSAVQMSFTPAVERLARRMFPGQVRFARLPLIYFCLSSSPGAAKVAEFRAPRASRRAAG
jgi:hypothetical protein